jgi:hypothetical protein
MNNERALKERSAIILIPNHLAGCEGSKEYAAPGSVIGGLVGLAA